MEYSTSHLHFLDKYTREPPGQFVHTKKRTSEKCAMYSVVYQHFITIYTMVSETVAHTINVAWYNLNECKIQQNHAIIYVINGL